MFDENPPWVKNLLTLLYLFQKADEKRRQPGKIWFGAKSPPEGIHEQKAINSAPSYQDLIWDEDVYTPKDIVLKILYSIFP